MKRYYLALASVALAAALLTALSPPSAGADEGRAGSISNPSDASSGHALWLQQSNPSDFLSPGQPAPPAPLPRTQGVGIGPVTGYVVRVAYIIPSNRVPQANGVANLQNAVVQYQSWYRDQMERNGFGPKTFRYETETGKVTPKIHTLSVAVTDAYLRGDLWGRTIDAASSAGVPVWTPKQVWWLIPEAHLEARDGSTSGGTALGASNGSGDDGGVSMVGGDALARYNPAFFTDDAVYAGQVIAAIGLYPLVQDVSFPWFEGKTFSSVSSSVLGAGIHETSHGFGLPHDYRNDQNFNGNLMGNGLRGLRGALFPARYPADYTRAGYGSALILNVSRYFNPDRTYTDQTTPTLRVTTAGTSSPVGGLLRIGFTASDAGGLSVALLQLNGDAVGEMALSGTSVSQTFATAYYLPGQANQFRISVWDTQGNKQSAETSIVPTTGVNRAPQPSVTLSTPTALVGQNVILSAANSTDPDGSLTGVKVEWDLNGAGLFDLTATTKPFTTNFTTAGDRLIRCRLTDTSGGQTVSAPLALRVLAPTLAVSNSGQGLQVSWSTQAGGFVLQTTPALSLSSWQPVTQVVTIVNGRNTLSLSNVTGSQFFQLRR